MEKQGGFTLVELMIGVAISAILLGVGVPNFQNLIEQNRLTSQINQFITALNTARSEALRRGQRVTVCKSDDGVDCGATDYAAGWIVFVDSANFGVRDAATEELLVVNLNDLNGYTLDANAGLNDFITYLPSGGVNSAGDFVLCKDNDTAKARALNILITGRASARQDNITACAI